MTLHYFSQLLKWISNAHRSWMVIYNTTFLRWCTIMCTRFLSTTPIYNIGFWAHSFHWSSKLGMERNVMNVYCMICISLSTHLSILTKDFEICSIVCSKFMRQGLLKGHVIQLVVVFKNLQNRANHLSDIGDHLNPP